MHAGDQHTSRCPCITVQLTVSRASDDSFAAEIGVHTSAASGEATYFGSVCKQFEFGKIRMPRNAPHHTCLGHQSGGNCLEQDLLEHTCQSSWRCNPAPHSVLPCQLTVGTAGGRLVRAVHVVAGLTGAVAACMTHIVSSVCREGALCSRTVQEWAAMRQQHD